MEFQEIKRKMAEITSDKTKPSEIYPTSRNNRNVLHTKLSGKPNYAKQSTLTNDNERRKQKWRPFPVINNYQVSPGSVTYNGAVQRKKKVTIICDSVVKSINLKGNLKENSVERRLFTVKLFPEWIQSIWTAILSPYYK